MERFACLKCGTCCNRALSEKLQGVREAPYFKDKFQFCYARTFLPLFDWEVSLFPVGSVLPHTVIYDQNNDETIVIDFTLNVDTCPHLSDERVCKIYDKRPVICRFFPCPYGDAGKLDASQNVSSAFGLCKAEMPAKELNRKLGFEIQDPKTGRAGARPSVVHKRLFERYGDSYVYGLATSRMNDACIRFVDHMQRDMSRKFAQKGYNPTFLKKRIDKSRKIAISDMVRQVTGTDLRKTFFSEEYLGQIRSELERLED